MNWAVPPPANATDGACSHFPVTTCIASHAVFCFVFSDRDESSLLRVLAFLKLISGDSAALVVRRERPLQWTQPLMRLLREPLHLGRLGDRQGEGWSVSTQLHDSSPLRSEDFFVLLRGRARSCTAVTPPPPTTACAPSSSPRRGRAACCAPTPRHPGRPRAPLSHTQNPDLRIVVGQPGHVRFVFPTLQLEVVHPLIAAPLTAHNGVTYIGELEIVLRAEVRRLASRTGPTAAGVRKQPTTASNSASTP